MISVNLTTIYSLEFFNTGKIVIENCVANEFDANSNMHSEYSSVCYPDKYYIVNIILNDDTLNKVNHYRRKK